MNHYIVPAEKAPTMLNLQVREKGTEEWSAESEISVQAGGMYQARFSLTNKPERFETLEFVMEIGKGGSFEPDRTAHCESFRAHGRGEKVVNFTVDGTSESVLLVGAWALGHSAVSLTPATLFRVGVTEKSPEL